VTSLKVKKPPGFAFKSGQWAQVAVNKLGKSEFHPFTMTSSPNEEYVTFHIRAVGPWTTNVRRLFDPSNRVGRNMPKVVEMVDLIYYTVNSSVIRITLFVFCNKMS